MSYCNNKVLLKVGPDVDIHRMKSEELKDMKVMLWSSRACKLEFVILKVNHKKKMSHILLWIIILSSLVCLIIAIVLTQTNNNKGSTSSDQQDASNYGRTVVNTLPIPVNINNVSIHRSIPDNVIGYYVNNTVIPGLESPKPVNSNMLLYLNEGSSAHYISAPKVPVFKTITYKGMFNSSSLDTFDTQFLSSIYSMGWDGISLYITSLMGNMSPLVDFLVRAKNSGLITMLTFDNVGSSFTNYAYLIDNYGDIIDAISPVLVDSNGLYDPSDPALHIPLMNAVDDIHVIPVVPSQTDASLGTSLFDNSIGYAVWNSK